jgi:hypothetical protein
MREALQRHLDRVLAALKSSTDLPEAIAKIESLLGGKD